MIYFIDILDLFFAENFAGMCSWQMDQLATTGSDINHGC